MFAQAWTGVASNPSSGMTTGTITTTSGNTICVGVMANSFNTIADADVTDSKGNTYTRVGTLWTNGAKTAGLFYAVNVTGGASHTITFTRGDASYGEICAVELSSMQTSSFDVSANSGNDHAAADPFDTTSATTTVTDTICAYFVSDGSPTFTAGTGYTVRSTPSGGVSMLETQDSVAAGSNNATASGGASLTYAAFLAAFKESGGGPSRDDGKILIAPIGYS